MNAINIGCLQEVITLQLSKTHFYFSIAPMEKHDKHYTASNMDRTVGFFLISSYRLKISESSKVEKSRSFCCPVFSVEVLLSIPIIGGIITRIVLAGQNKHSPELGNNQIHSAGPPALSPTAGDLDGCQGNIYNQDIKALRPVAYTGNRPRSFMLIS